MFLKLMDSISTLQKLYKENPLKIILFVAISIRLLAAFFSQGFGMHDDHFLVIEAAQAWVDGIIVPGQPIKVGAPVIADGHSLSYMGLHYLLFRILAFLNITDPQFKMLIVRLIHASVSVLSVWLAYKITEKLSNRKDASLVGILLALLWFLPMLSVRNLVEIFCIPFTLLSTWIIVRSTDFKNQFLWYLLAGFIAGLSISVRFQLIVFVGGMGLVLLLQRKWLHTLAFGIGTFLSIILLQGWVDYVLFGYPFAEFIEYVNYNIKAAYSYITGPWYNYILLLAGILLPPVSLMILFGYFRSWRKQLLIFLPAFLFLVFHSFFPNKQERFIFPILPYLIIGGIIGWNDFIEKSTFWKLHLKALNRVWIVFWVLNILLLLPVSFAYSKRSRVEAMAYLQKYKNIEVILAEDSNKESVQMLPRFYSKHWMFIFNKSSNGYGTYLATNKYYEPKDAAFVAFYSDENLKTRVDSMLIQFPFLKYEATFKPGLIDNIMHQLNPVNRNETIYLYRNKAVKLDEN